MDSFKNMDVKIIYLNNAFIASSSLFPDCKGKGETRELALKSLSKRISAFMYKAVNDNLSDLLSSDKYTELILDHTQPVPVQHRVFNLDPNVFHLTKTLLIKTKPFPKEAIKDKPSDLQDLLNRPSRDTSRNIDTTTMDTLDIENKFHQNEEDGIAFGFPLSLN